MLSSTTTSDSKENRLILENWDVPLMPITYVEKMIKWDNQERGWIKLNTDRRLSRKHAGYSELMRDEGSKIWAICYYRSPR